MVHTVERKRNKLLLPPTVHHAHAVQSVVCCQEFTSKPLVAPLYIIACLNIDFEGMESL